jgi:hypothetical protein
MFHSYEMELYSGSDHELSSDMEPAILASSDSVEVAGG